MQSCRMPTGVSATTVINNVRAKLQKEMAEFEFMVVLDIKKEPSELIDELEEANIAIVHVHEENNNSAKNRLKFRMRRLAAILHPPATIILLSSDEDFALDMYELRYCYLLNTILIHDEWASLSLLEVVNEHYLFTEFCKSSLAVIVSIQRVEMIQKKCQKEYLIGHECSKFVCHST